MLLDPAVLDEDITQPIPETVRQLIISTIWGPTADTPAHVNKLRRLSVDLPAYFEYYYKKVVHHRTCRDHSGLKSHKEVLFFISLLKANPNLTREALYDACLFLSEQDAVAAQGEATVPTTVSSVFDTWADGRLPLDIDAALAVAVRTMLALNISLESDPNQNTIAPSQSHVIWKASESLVQLVDREFPKDQNLSTSSQIPIKLGNLRARSLQDHFGIKLKWTQHFADHLKLDIGIKSKSLTVFELASVLEISVETTVKEPASLSIENSLKIGCYPPALLRETQKTFALLFPARDWSWLDREIRPRSIWFHGKTLGLDSRLSYVLSDQDTGLQSITDSKQLFDKYPYWASRLHAILEEVDNPTPISWFGRWAERRKSARHTFRLTYLGIIIAVLFGMAATGLAAVSVWISYCSWQGDIGGACKLRSPKNETASAAPLIQ